MAHDRMTNEDLDRKMGRAGQDDDPGKKDFGKQTPGRNPQDPAKDVGQKNKPHTEDEEDFGGGSTGNPGRQNR